MFTFFFFLVDIEHSHVKFLGSLVLNLWDCGGQDAYMDSYCKKIIYYLDANISPKINFIKKTTSSTQHSQQPKRSDFPERSSSDLSLWHWKQRTFSKTNKVTFHYQLIFISLYFNFFFLCPPNYTERPAALSLLPRRAPRELTWGKGVLPSAQDGPCPWRPARPSVPAEGQRAQTNVRTIRSQDLCDVHLGRHALQGLVRHCALAHPQHHHHRTPPRRVLRGVRGWWGRPLRVGIVPRDRSRITHRTRGRDVEVWTGLQRN